MRAMSAPPKKRGRGRPKDAGLTDRRRREIIGAATPLFAARGYANTDLQAVADALGLGKGTLYRYFPSKRKLFLAAVADGMARLEEAVFTAASEGEDPLDGLVRAFRAHLAFFRKNPDFGELMVEERAELSDRKESTYFEQRDRNIGPWQDFIQALIDEGRIRRMPPARITDVLSDLLYGVPFKKVPADSKKAPDAAAEDMIDIILHGILSDEERARRPAKR
jgi:AcrR family transcriptional regulator